MTQPTTVSFPQNDNTVEFTSQDGEVNFAIADDDSVSFTNEENDINFTISNETTVSFTNEDHAINFQIGNEVAITFEIGTIGGAIDPHAFHDHISGEIFGVTGKSSLIDADVLLLEDSADGYSKKKVTRGDLLTKYDSFIKLSDTPNAYTLPNAIYNVNGAGDAVNESSTLLTEPALNQFQIARGTTALLMQGDLTVESASFLNQDLTTDASPTFANITGTLLTASQPNVDHDSLTNFVANEHINHTSVTLTAGEGLSGGGDISANRTFALDLSELPIDAAIGAGDYVAIHDGANKRITFANFEGDIDHTNILNIGTNTHAQIDTFIGTTVPATYVPYTGAITNVELGVNNLTTGGLISTDTMLEFTLNAGVDIENVLFKDFEIYLDDNKALVLGDGNDSKIYYDGTDLIIDPNLVGTGLVSIGASSNDGLKLGYIDFNLTPSVSSQEGRMMWDADDGTVTIGMPGGNVMLQVGQEGLIRVRNISGANIANGELVYVTGSSGNKLTINLADNTDADTIQVLGMVTEDINNNSNGYVALWGTVRGDALQPIDTSTHAEGTKLYLSTAGTWTATHPPNPSHATIIIGIVERQHASLGEISLQFNYFTIGNNFDGTLRQSIINKNTGTSAACGFTSVNDAGHFATVGIGGSNSTLFPDNAIFYGPGYNDNLYAVDGNKSHKWFNDPTDSHDNSSLNFLRMELNAAGVLNLPTAITSTDKDTGTLTVQGGVGIEENLNIGGALGVVGNSILTGTLTVNDTTDSTSKDTGCVILEGGMGVEKGAYIGTHCRVGGTPTTATTFNLVSTSAVPANFETTAAAIFIGIKDSASNALIRKFGNDIGFADNTATIRPIVCNISTADVTVGNDLTVSGTTDSTSATTGSIKTVGGMGVAKNLFVGDNITVVGGNDSNLIIGDQALSSLDTYTGIKTSFQSGTGDFMIVSGKADGHTYLSAKLGSSVNIHGGGNNNKYKLEISATKAQFFNDLIIGDGNAGEDFTLTFNGETNDGVLTWMEDEDYFDFADMAKFSNGIHDGSDTGTVNDILVSQGASTTPLWKAPTVGIPISFSMYDAEPARGSETSLDGAFLVLATGQPLNSVPTDLIVSKGTGKLVVVVNAGSDIDGDITVTGTSVDRETGATTPADTDIITIDALTTDNSDTDANSNIRHAFTGAYITSKWFTGTVTLSTANLTLTDVDVYHASFEQFDDQSDLTLETFDANIFTTNVNAEFDAYLYSLEVTGDKCNITREASLNVGADGETAIADKYWRLRRGNINKALDGATDGVWADIHYSNSPAYVEDVTIKIWAMKSQTLTLA